MSSPDPDPATAAPSRAVADCKVFVGGLHPLTTAETLCGYFGRRFGEVIDAVVMIDRATGRSRGFGFVTFREAADAASAIEASATAKKQAAEAAEKKKKTKSGGDDEGGGGGGEDDDDDSNVDVLTAAPTRVEPLEVDGKVVDAKLASSSSRGGENANANASSADAARADAAAKRLFVGGLTRETTEDSMREYFSQFGDVVKAEVMRHTQGDHKGESRCFGFVTFDAEEATDAVFTAGEDGDGSQGGGYHQLDGKRIQCKRIDVDAPRDSHARGGGGGGGGGRRDRDGGGGYRNNQRGGRYDDRGYGYGYGMGASVGPGGGMMTVNPSGMYGAYGALVASQGMAGMNAMMPPMFGAMTAPAFYQTYGGGGGGRFGRGGSGGRGGGGRGGGRYRPY